MIEELIEQAKQISHDKRGSNSVCYCFGEYALLYGSIDRNNIDRKIENMNNYIARGFNIAPILEYKYDESAKITTYSNGDSFQHGWTMQARAKGKELERNVSGKISITSVDNLNEQYLAIKEAKQKYIEVLDRQSSVDERHLNKFITDYQTILEEGILIIDPSKASNFFYDENEGFTFIDINISRQPYEKSRQLEFLPRYILLNLLPKLPYVAIKEEGVKNSDTIVSNIPLTEEEFKIIDQKQKELSEKIARSLTILGWDKETIDKNVNSSIVSRDDSTICEDDKSVYKVLANQFSVVVSNNRANGLRPNNASKRLENDGELTIDT